MEKVVKIGGKETRLVANGGTPRFYRAFFKKDIFEDMTNAVADDGSIKNAEVFENLAFVMAKQGGLDGGYSVEDWLASFESPMAIIEAVPEILEVWMATTETTVEAKKN